MIRAFLCHEVRGPVPHVAEALYDVTLAFQCFIASIGPGLQGDHDTVARGPVATLQPTGAERLTGHHVHIGETGARRLRAAERIGDPSHDLGIGVHVRCGNVQVRPDVVAQCVGEPARDALELALGILFGVDLDTALATAVWQPGQGGLPGHPDSERPCAVDIHRGVVPQPALVGPQRVVVLYPVAGEHFDGAIIQLHREVYHDLVVGLAQDLADPGIQPHDIGGALELLHHHLVHALPVLRLLGAYCFHR